jgi:osmotically inducible protein OsmC
MQLVFLIQRAGAAAEELSTEAAVSLVPDGEGFKIDRSALTLRAKVPGMDQAKFDELARTAEKSCPVSRLLNAEITLEATLES